MIFLKKYLLYFVVTISLLSIGSFVSAQSSDTDWKKKEEEYKQKLVELGQQKNTLSTQIEEMDTQMYLTGLNIQRSEQKVIATQSEIEKLGSRIDNLDSSLEKLFTQLRQRAVKQYKTMQPTMFDLVFDADSIELLIKKIKYQKTAKENSEKLYIQVQAAKLNYEEQKVIREEKKQELDQLIQNLEAQKVTLKTQQTQKQKLLVETNNDESTYQSLLAQAQAQLKGFSSFVTTQGGSGILSNQTSCDDWGCYYNQRDSQWGNIVINGRYDCGGACSIAKVGCLITSVAMMVSHQGNKGILPSDIVYTSSNFWPGTASLNRGTIYANGKSINRTTISNSLSSDQLQSGPVIVGINYGPFGTHFVVVKSFTDGKYIMNDPYTEGGKDKNFTDYYSLDSVFEVDRISL